MVSQLLAVPGFGHGGWTELNIGPFYLYCKGDTSEARDYLTQLEQLRWVLGGLLDSRDLPALWPLRIVLTKNEKTNPPLGFVWKSAPLFGQREFVRKSGTPAPLAEIGGLLLDDNTPRLSPDAESGLRKLLASLQAHGSHVTWGGPVPDPDLAWARMQLFATRFEYGASFHVFVTSLKNGSSIRVAERNAFNRDPDTLEKEAAANLAAGHWEAVPVSGRPLDPKRDLGEHAVDDAVVNAYMAAADADPKAADAAFKAAIEAGPPAMALGYEGLAALAAHDGEDPQRYLEDALRAGSTSPPVYLMAARHEAALLGQPKIQREPADVAAAHLKTAISLNPRWAEPVHEQALQASQPLEKEALLRKAVALEPRQTSYWLELAEVQMTDGHAETARGSWMRAEDSSATAEERERIHNDRLAREQDRLDAAEAERQRDRNQTHLADQQAQDAESARIRAAEERANQALDAQAGGDKPQQVVPWQDTVPKRNLSGALTAVECLNGSDRLSIKDRSGHTVTLLLTDPSQITLTCGPQQPARRVTISYALEPDERLHTSGRVLTLEVQ